MNKKSKKIKHLLLDSISILALSAIVIATAVGCSLSKSNNNTNNHLKSNVNKTTSLTNSTNENNLILQQIKNNKTITIASSKTYNPTLLKAEILKEILKKISNSCSKQQLQELQKNLKINLPTNLSYSNKKPIQVIIDYKNKALSTINVQINNSIWTSIAFAQTNYNLNLQNGGSWTSFNIKPIIQNWQNGCEIQYSLQLDNSNIYKTISSSMNEGFTIPSNVSNFIQNSLLPSTNNFATATLTATLINPNNNQSNITTSTMITINNNPLFLYATSAFKSNIQSVNLNCYVNEIYNLSFENYKPVSSSKVNYYLVEEVNSSSNTSPNIVKTQLTNTNASNKFQNFANSIKEIAHYGIVTYYLQIQDALTNKVIVTSNSVTINCNKQGGVTITNPNLNPQTSTITLDLSKSNECVLTINNNLPEITYNANDILYEVASNNNEWLPITDASALFKASLQDNQLILSDLASEIAINIKLANEATNLYSNIVTIYTKAPNSIWTQFKNNNVNETIQPGSNYNDINGTSGQTFNLSFLPPDINLSNVEYNWSMLTNTGFVSIGSNQPNFTKTFTNTGIYVVRMQVSWDNDINASALTYLFKFTILEDNLSEIKTYTSELNNYINTNLNNILLNYFETSPGAILPFINTSAKEWQLASNVTVSNFNQYFKINSVSFNSNKLLTANLSVLNTLTLNNSNSSLDSSITKGATLELTMPFSNSLFLNSGSISNFGDSEMNVSSSNSNTYNGSVGWELSNSSNTTLNNQFIAINTYDLNSSDYTMNITSSNSNNALPTYFNNITQPVTHTIIWNMQTSQYIRVDDVEGGNKTILFFPSFFPYASRASYSLYEVSGNEMSNNNITGTLVSTNSSANFTLDPNSKLINQSFTYYCICTYVVNNVTYTARSQNILVTYTNGSTV
ncbi:MAG: hypothetical protein IIT78_00270 [Mycoplasmataceae bacterium]|nr:hypothetical protein [Mycoplasmataceae bacterium]